MTDTMTHKHMELYVQLQQAQYLRPPFAKVCLRKYMSGLEAYLGTVGM